MKLRYRIQTLNFKHSLGIGKSFKGDNIHKLFILLKDEHKL